jgi:histidinol-phosphate aminotransferase
MFDLQRLVRTTIRNLQPYSAARSEFAGMAEVYLDANENAFGSPAGDGLNRYPDPMQMTLKERVAHGTGLSPSQIFVGNGSDEAIDLLFRVFCEPGRDQVITCPPTYGMYRVSAEINDIDVLEIRLTSDFQLDVPAVLSGIDENTKLIFLCSPNNPTGNLMRRESIIEIAEKFKGVVVVDEAYIHYASEPSLKADLERLPNLVILQTFSKAWGMAGARVGLAYSSVSIIGWMNRIKPPYNVSSLAQTAVLKALNDNAQIEKWTQLIVSERARLSEALARLELVEMVYPSDANFLLIKVADAEAVYRSLLEEKIVVRKRNNVELCNGCLRVTIGTQVENDRLLSSLQRKR